MEIKIDYIEDWLKKCDAKNMLHPFLIYFDLDGVYYPDNEWYDNGAIIIIWWIESLTYLAQGSSHEELSFMEGPYKIIITREHKDIFKITAKGIDKSLHITLSDLSNEILKCAKTIVDIFSKNNITNYRIDLEKAISVYEHVVVGQNS